MKKITLLLVSLIFLFGCTSQASWVTETKTDLVTTYKGTAQLQGWMLYKPYYAGKAVQPHFHVADESLISLPPELIKKLPDKPYLREFVIMAHSGDEVVLAPEDVISNLKNFDQKNIATITVDEIDVVSEGSPFLILATSPQIQ